MAYITQDEKKIIAAALKVALKDYPTIKYSLTIDNNMSISCRLTKGPKFFDPEGKGEISVNHHHIAHNFKHEPEAVKILTLINECLHIGHYDKSDIQSDYFDCAWYISMGIGKWNKPYEVVWWSDKTVINN